ncbi:ribosome maturation factor RimP [Nocardiopsis coralliicola]
MGAQEQVAALLEPVLAQAGLDLEAVEIAPAGKRRLLRVVVDSDDGVDLDKVGDVSRDISAALDSSDAMGGAPYVLEVSSPGVDRPLTLPRHWRRSLGRLVAAQRAGGAGEVAGRIAEASETGVVLETGSGTESFGYAELERARIQVEFRRDGDGGDTAAAD